MDYIIEYGVNIVFGLLGFFILIGILIRLVKQQAAKETTVKATVVDKQTYTKTIHAKAQAPREQQIYTVTFLCSGKKLTFYTNAETFHTCHIKQTGQLTYKGLTLIDFTIK